MYSNIKTVFRRMENKQTGTNESIRLFWIKSKHKCGPIRLIRRVITEAV